MTAELIFAGVEAGAKLVAAAESGAAERFLADLVVRDFNVELGGTAFIKPAISEISPLAKITELNSSGKLYLQGSYNRSFAWMPPFLQIEPLSSPALKALRADLVHGVPAFAQPKNADALLTQVNDLFTKWHAEGVSLQPEVLQARARELEERVAPILGKIKAARVSIGVEPAAKMELMGEGANYSTGLGHITVPDTDLSGRQTFAQAGVLFARQLGHELNHDVQDTMIVWNHLDTAARTGLESPALASSLYRSQGKGQLSESFLSRVASVRNGHMLTPQVAQRSETLTQAWRESFNPGQQFVASEKPAQQLGELAATVSNPFMVKSGERAMGLLTDSTAGGAELRQLVFRGDVFPADMWGYADEYKSTQHLSATSNEGARQAVYGRVFKPLNQLNAYRQGLFNRYMKYHEMESFYTGAAINQRGQLFLKGLSKTAA